MGALRRIAPDGPCDAAERGLARARSQREDAILVDPKSVPQSLCPHSLCERCGELFGEELAQVNRQGAFEI